MPLLKKFSFLDEKPVFIICRDAGIIEERQSMLDAYPSLQNMYAADDGNTQVFYFRNAKATISSFTHGPESFNI